MRNDDIQSEPRGAEADAEALILEDARAAAVDRSEPHRLDMSAGPVLDEAQMSKFVALMGADWVAKGLRRFAVDVEGRMAALASATPSDLAVISHGMIMMAAHCGFAELQYVAEEVQREARLGAGLNRVAELRRAGERALAVMRTYTPRP